MADKKSENAKAAAKKTAKKPNVFKRLMNNRLSY